jgi:rhamnogalacturonan endolyase
MRTHLIFVLVNLLAAGAALAAEGAPVVLEDGGAQVRLSNGLVSIVVDKSTATIGTMMLGKSPNLAGRGAYFAVANSGGHDGWDIHNAVFRVVRNTPDLVELSFGAPVGGIYFTQHYVMVRGVKGFYVYVVMEHRPGQAPEGMGQIRWSFYLDPNLFNYQLASDSEQGQIPDMRGSTPVQDATVRLPDGTVYTKYNYCTYIEEDDVHGECGSRPGSYGVFMVMPGKEYLQAPTKQEITVHAGPIVHRFLASGHFEPRELTSPMVPVGWVKCCGPWLVYLNSGDSPKQMWADAKEQVVNERAQWPYQWMQDPNYPLRRGTVTGDLKLYDGNQPASYALMVLTSPQPDWQIQVQDYIFSTRADADGHFTLPHVRPGTYTLFAIVPGVTGEFRRDRIVVTADGTVDLGRINYVPAYYSAKLWEIGFADRRTTGFRLSDQPRQYGLDQEVPANLTYTISVSTPSRDWYYSQAKPGDWKIDFDVPRSYGGQGVLTIGIAGQTSNPYVRILLNDKQISYYTGGNSSAEYRSAILGSSYYEEGAIRFPASQLHVGKNTITLRLTSGAVMYDVLKLEIDDPNLPRRIPPTPVPPEADLIAWKAAGGQPSNP